MKEKQNNNYILHKKCTSTALVNKKRCTCRELPITRSCPKQRRNVEFIEKIA